MELELVEGLVDLLRLTGDSKTGDHQIFGLHGSHRGSVVDIVAGGEEVVGVDTHGKISPAGPIERPANSGSVTGVDEAGQAQLG